MISTYIKSANHIEVLQVIMMFLIGKKNIAISWTFVPHIDKLTSCFSWHSHFSSHDVDIDFFSSHDLDIDFFSSHDLDINIFLLMALTLTFFISWPWHWHFSSYDLDIDFFLMTLTLTFFSSHDPENDLFLVVRINEYIDMPFIELSLYESTSILFCN